jgi:hypothetical protein
LHIKNDELLGVIWDIREKKGRGVGGGGRTRGEDFAEFGTLPKVNLHSLDQIFYLEISFQVIMKKITYIYVFDPIYFY